MPPKHRGKRPYRAPAATTDEEVVDSDEKPGEKNYDELLTQKVVDLKNSCSSGLSGLQFVLATLSIAIALYLLLQTGTRVHNWRPNMRQTATDRFGRLRDHRYVEARPDGISWSGPSRVSSAQIDVVRQEDSGWRNASQQVWSGTFTTRCDMVIKSWKKMTLVKFEAQYRNKKPLLIRFPGGAKEWTDPVLFNHTNLLKALSDWDYRHEKRNGRDTKDTGTPDGGSLENYISSSGSGTSNILPFQFDAAFFDELSLSRSIDPPDYLNSSYYDVPLPMQFASSMVSGPFKHHSGSWSGLVFGYRRWFLYPPTQAPPGGSSMDVTEWFHRIRPRLDAPEMAMECIQKPGDILYIPESWYHGSISLGDTVAVGYRKSSNERCLSTLIKQIDSIKIDHTMDAAKKIHAIYPRLVRLHEAYPSNAEVLNMLGVAHAARGEMVEAVQTIDKALMLDPFLMDSYLNLAKIYFSAEDFTSAEEYFKLALHISPHSADVCRLYGKFLVSRRRIHEAIEVFQAGATYNPEKASVFQELLNRAQT